MKLKGKTSLAYRKQDGYKDIEIYENYFLLHKSVIATFESTFIPHLYNEFYAYLEHKFEEKWTWDVIRKSKHRDFMLLAHRLNTCCFFCSF